MIWTIIYLSGFIGTLIFMNYAFKIAPGHMTRDLKAWQGVLMALIWPVFWVIVGLAIRDERG